MAGDPYGRYAPFIRDYIYAKGWRELHGIQGEACSAIMDTGDHVLLASGTASGKTEAAFFPILTLLERDMPVSIGALYIGPLKALINDQWGRMREMLEGSPIGVRHWHGDVGAGEKRGAALYPSGVLQITPESLEALLILRSGEVERMFCDLRFVVIDEVHAFMGGDRGGQVLCQIGRIQAMAGCVPRRVGLSATLGDYGAAGEWLAGGTGVPVTAVSGGEAGRKVRIAVESFDEVGDVCYGYIYGLSRGKGCVVFTNRRADAERAVSGLRKAAVAGGGRDVFRIHHGSLSAAIRADAEDSLRDGGGEAVAVATVTLELGIDIGRLDRIFQIGAPPSCSSFVQRLGRSGRRSGVSEMVFCCGGDDGAYGDDPPTGADGPWDARARPGSPGSLPWGLLQTIAVIELYAKDRYIEPPQRKPLPYSLLYHQTMSCLASCEGMGVRRLLGTVMGLAPFRGLDEADFWELLRHLIKTGHVHEVDGGELVVGDAGSRLAYGHRFYAVFKDEDRYAVISGETEVGSVSTMPYVGAVIFLAGRPWRIVSVDPARKAVHVVEGEGEGRFFWTGGMGDVDDRVMAKARVVLLSDERYPYLMPGAKRRLEEARVAAAEMGLGGGGIVRGDDGTAYLLPWKGGKVMRGLERLLGIGLRERLGVGRVMGYRPYYLHVSSRHGYDGFLGRLRDAGARAAASATLLREGESPVEDRYDEYLPEAMRARAYVRNRLAGGAELAEAVEGMLRGRP
ncbi:MAG: DEAD/DEAH box helicase [Oscillospiraceae bacterium]|nr:DEAD/DEAH box helicase [Oscillospiraceae bacterium]